MKTYPRRKPYGVYGQKCPRANKVRHGICNSLTERERFLVLSVPGGTVLVGAHTYNDTTSRNLCAASCVSISMTLYYSFRIFLVCLVSCATMALGAVWLQDSITSPVYFQTTASLFILGLASFLIWFSLILGCIYGSLRNTK